jgi:hypothetical protein
MTVFIPLNLQCSFENDTLYCVQLNNTPPITHSPDASHSSKKKYILAGSEVYHVTLKGLRPDRSMKFFFTFPAFYYGGK